MNIKQVRVGVFCHILISVINTVHMNGNLRKDMQCFYVALKTKSRTIQVSKY